MQDTNVQAEEAAGIRCNFEAECHWTWDKSENNTFQVVTSSNISDTGMKPGPSADNTGDVKGNCCIRTTFCLEFGEQQIFAKILN